MADLIITERSNIIAIADAVRNRTGKTENITLSEMAYDINYVVGGADTSDATATADDILSGETAYANGEKITGTFTIDSELTTQDNLIEQIQAALEGKAGGSDPVLQSKTVSPTTSAQTVTPDSGYDGLSKVTVNAMPTATQATPTVSIDSAGKITATATQAAGYVAAGTKTGTKQLTTQAAKTITPSTSSQTAVASGRYTTGAVTVAGDANLKAENIAEGVSIFGVTGTHSGGGSGGGSVETCTFTMSIESPISGSCYIYYVDGNMAQQSATVAMMDSATVTVLKNSLLCVTTGIMTSSGSLTTVYNNVYYISGDATAAY